MEKATSSLEFVKNACELFKTSKSNNITSMERQKGFSSVDLKAQTVKFIKMDLPYFKTKYVKRIEAALSINSSAQKEFQQYLEDAAYSDGGKTKIFALMFTNGQGKALMFTIEHLIYPDINKIDFGYNIAAMNFELAPVVVKRRIIKSNILNTTEYDQISYLPSNITEEEMNSLLCSHLKALE